MVRLPLAGVVALLLLGSQAAAETLVLDAAHVTDWVRLPVTSGWKYRDACLTAPGLLKFDLDFHWPVAQVVSARLELFAEAAGPLSSVEFWHVTDDSWSYGLTDPQNLEVWPKAHAIGTLARSDSGPLLLDVTDHVREELLASGNHVLSIELISPAAGMRIASPLVMVERMRPRLVVEVQGTGATPLPDLAVSDADLRLSPARPAPGQTTTLTAWVRNLGPAEASDVAVSFWDGPPGSGTPIGSATIPALAAGGGTAPASITWVASAGVHDLYAVADPLDAIAETDETNDADFREFQIAEVVGAGGPATTLVESFESEGLHGWHTDFESPRVNFAFGTRTFYLERSGAGAYHGHHALELYLDGTSDDGTIWIETALPVEPGTTQDVSVDFEFFRYQPDLAFFPVVSIGVLDPELESDFPQESSPNAAGWSLISRQKTVEMGPFDRLRIGVGMTVSWETPGSFLLDLVRVQATPVGVGATPAPRPLESRLDQNAPNPMGPLTTIAYALPAAGAVRLEIFDLGGRRVATVRDAIEPEGRHEAHWNGVDAAGRPAPAGVYLYRLTAPGVQESRKLLLVR